MSPGVPDDVRALLERHISSVRQLDLVLVLRDAGTGRDWSVQELNARLRSSETALEHDLAELLDVPLVTATDGPPTRWRYAPGPAARTLDTLAACYRTHRTSVIRMVATSPTGTGSLGDFADAFRIRRRTDPDG